eukprot:gene12451-26194_t
MIEISSKFKRSHVYQSYSIWQKRFILLGAAMVSLLGPFTDTIYLPAFGIIAEDLSATDEKVAATVSSYLAAIGYGQLIWGPLSDYYGRRPILLITFVLFAAFTVGCIFPNDVDTLLVLRTIEGLMIGAGMLSVQAVIADVFPPEERGAANGSFMIPLLVGPVIAPLIGGVFAQAYSWRAVFVVLIVMSAPVLVFLVLFMPESHHWYVIRQRPDVLLEAQIKPTSTDNGNGNGNGNDKGDDSVIDQLVTVDLVTPPPDGLPIPHPQSQSTLTPTAKDADIDIDIDIDMHIHKAKNGDVNMVEEGDEDIPEPVLMMPWVAAGFVFDPELAPHYAAVSLTFACTLTSLTLLTVYLSVAPYTLSATIIGTAYLPVGMAMLIGSLIGGHISDWLASRYPDTPDGRLLIPSLLGWICPLGTILFGIVLHLGWPLYAVMLTHCLVGFGQATLMPSTLSFLSVARPASAGVASSAMIAWCFMLAAVMISVSIQGSHMLGVDVFSAIITGISGLACLWSTITCFYRWTTCFNIFNIFEGVYIPNICRIRSCEANTFSSRIHFSCFKSSRPTINIELALE